MVTKEIYVLLRDRKLVQNKAVRSMVNMDMVWYLKYIFMASETEVLRPAKFGRA